MKILIFAPHADDEVLGVGGTIAKYTDEGNDIYICVVTTGHPSMFNQDVLVKLRSETLEAHTFLGIKESIFLEFPAVMLSELPRYEVIKKLDEVIDYVQPDIVFIPHFGDIHLDHLIVSQSVMVGVRPTKGHRILEVYSYETLSETEWNIPHIANVFIPNTFIDITDYLNKKKKALEFFSTQLIEFPHPRSIQAIEALAKLRGSTIGVRAAEAFFLVRKTIL